MQKIPNCRTSLRGHRRPLKYTFIFLQQIQQYFVLKHKSFSCLAQKYMVYRHSLGSKLTCAILSCPWEKHFTALFPSWWFWQPILNFSHISTKFQADSNILVSPKAAWGNCLPYVLAPPSFPASQEDKDRDKKNKQKTMIFSHA